MSNPLRAQIHPTAAGTIGIGGLIAGALDITDAIVFYYFRGVPPVSILQSIASGLLGAEGAAAGQQAHRFQEAGLALSVAAHEDVQAAAQDQLPFFDVPQLGHLQPLNPHARAPRYRRMGMTT